MATEDIHVSVPFSPEQHEALQEAAKQEGRSKASQVRHYCTPHLARVRAAMRRAAENAPANIRKATRKA
jgi:predicted urease superfamily metal-dependent hydrolase